MYDIMVLKVLMLLVLTAMAAMYLQYLGTRELVQHVDRLQRRGNVLLDRLTALNFTEGELERLLGQEVTE